MYHWRHRTKQALSCKSCHTFWLLNHCFDAIFHWLYFLNILCILDFLLSILLYPLPSNGCFFFDFPLFCYFFSFLIITITFSLITLFHLLLTHAFSLVFIGFTLFKFSFCSSTLSTLFLWSSFVCCFSFLFEYFFFDFLVFFYSLTLFPWISCYWWLLLFFLDISGCIYALWFLLQCNLMLNYFWLTSSGGCSNHTFRRLIPQGTHN